MKPRKRTERTAYQNGPTVSVKSVKDQSSFDDNEFDFLNDIDKNEYSEDDYSEDGDMSFVDDKAPSQDDLDNAEKEIKKMSDEDIKIKALNQAINVAKLMSDVTTDDVIEIAKKLAKFIKG